jgi:hypothetical protein
MVEPFQSATSPLATGGRIGICRLPGADGDLAGDVTTIARWKPRLVVSLTESAEMERLGAQSLPDMLAGLGVEWRHFPIIDFGTPGPATLIAWPPLSVEIHAVLDQGGDVLIHCRGGLGRSGMIALRLMVERGEEPDEALSRLRQARPGAVETDEQRAWGSAGARQTMPTTGLGL